MKPVSLLVALIGSSAFIASALAQHDASHHGHVPGHGAGHADMQDGRELVAFPAPMRAHTLSNMRDHLKAMGDIQAAMSKEDLDLAARIAEQRLGMSSLEAHGAHDLAGFMPEGMRAAGTAMHRSASQLAVELRNTGATGDWKPSLASFARLTQTCVACHAAYRLQ
ncbi:hypothetical protein [Hydrogenophaga sp. 5NK40-0174]|uniref:hypothetical protein n=1 Tax=Hydrogenophaga sp. 5NK40-0174 TaxID=3127649 RepID=UPI003103A37E